MFKLWKARVRPTKNPKYPKTRAKQVKFKSRAIESSPEIEVKILCSKARSRNMLSLAKTNNGSGVVKHMKRPNYFFSLKVKFFFEMKLFF